MLWCKRHSFRQVFLCCLSSTGLSSSCNLREGDRREERASPETALASICSTSASCSRAWVKFKKQKRASMGKNVKIGDMANTCKRQGRQACVCGRQKKAILGLRA